MVTFLLHLPPNIAFTAGDEGSEKTAGTNTPCFEPLLSFLAHRSLAGLIWSKLTLLIDVPNQGPKGVTWQGLFQQQGVMGSITPAWVCGYGWLPHENKISSGFILVSKSSNQSPFPVAGNGLTQEEAPGLPACCRCERWNLGLGVWPYSILLQSHLLSHCWLCPELCRDFLQSHSW